MRGAEIHGFFLIAQYPLQYIYSHYAHGFIYFVTSLVAYVVKFWFCGGQRDLQTALGKID